MENSQQNYNKDKEMEKDPDARTAKGSNDPSHRAPGAGITNRPDEEERENQERLPPRGQAKAGD
jgi:hypothetical protein